jgi:hypothetical protein
MTEIQDLRARMREERTRQPVAAEPGSGLRIPFGVLAVGAVVLGFVVVFFTPRIYPAQRTAALPAFRDVQQRIENPGAAAAMTPVAVPEENSARYTDKSFDEMARIADGVCFQRAHAAVPHWSKTPRLTTKELSDFADVDGARHFAALLHCLVTEAPARYCVRAQRNMIKAEIVTYFRGIDHANAATRKVVAELRAAPRNDIDDSYGSREANPDVQKLAALTFTPDDKVMRGVEALMQAGYLPNAERADIGKSVAPAIRDRFARVVGSKLPCPDPPWWAVWK